MPALVGLVLSFLVFDLLKKFGLTPEYTVFWCFQIPAQIIILLAIQFLWVNKIQSKND